MQKRKTIAVLAAGIGARYGGLKQMDPIGPSGEFIIDYSVYDAMRAGFNRVIFIIRKDIENDFRATIGARVARHVQVDYVFQELANLPGRFSPPQGRTKPWGTVQAMLACSGVVRKPFAVINADDYYGREAYEVLSRGVDALDPASTDYCMVGFRLNNTLSEHGSVTRGVARSNADGYLQELEEVPGIEKTPTGARCATADGAEKTLSGNELVSMNMWGFTPKVFADLRRAFTAFLRRKIDEPKSELVIPTAVGDLITAGKATVKVLSTGSPWFGITHPADRPQVVGKINDLVERGVYPRRLWD
ncbi:MAG: nucleotidyltransferase [Planctomycetes bacterium]|nr:nucleotidyltransferase [Planctomycetota bacterium]